MALSEKIEAARNKKPCAFQLTLDSMSKEDRAAYNLAVKEKMPWRALQRALRAEGYKVSTESMTVHTKGLCRCPK